MAIGGVAGLFVCWFALAATAVRPRALLVLAAALLTPMALTRHYPYYDPTYTLDQAGQNWWQARQQ